ncbi:Thioredoxin [Candidatus Hodgkinia cicadicola]|nr:Thioredoxin [Candidatus Hodgkinia cicadicola]
MLELRNLKRVLESKVSSLALILSSWCRACANPISLVLDSLPSASEWKLKLLSFDSNYGALIKLGINIWLLFSYFKAILRWP